MGLSLVQGRALMGLAAPAVARTVTPGSAPPAPRPAKGAKNAHAPPEALSSASLSCEPALTPSACLSQTKDSRCQNKRIIRIAQMLGRQGHESNLHFLKAAFRKSEAGRAAEKEANLHAQEMPFAPIWRGVRAMNQGAENCALSQRLRAAPGRFEWTRRARPGIVQRHEHA